MSCGRSPGTVHGATGVGNLEEVWSNALLSSRGCLRRNASRHVEDKFMEQEVQWILDELGEEHTIRWLVGR